MHSCVESGRRQLPAKQTGEIPASVQIWSSALKIWRCRIVGLVQEFAKLPGGINCLEGSNPSISAKKLFLGLTNGKIFTIFNIVKAKTIKKFLYIILKGKVMLRSYSYSWSYKSDSQSGYSMYYGELSD